MSKPTSYSTRYDMQTPALQISRDDMPPAWRNIYDDYMARGFTIAAANMREIMRFMSPRSYWAHMTTKGAEIRASI